MNYYNFSPQETLKKLKSSEAGLSKKEAQNRLKQYGRNEIQVAGTPLWKKIIEPLVDIFMLVLIFAGDSTMIKSLPIMFGGYIQIPKRRARGNSRKSRVLSPG